VAEFSEDQVLLTGAAHPDAFTLITNFPMDKGSTRLN
jgi:hypothetical protein